MNKSIKKLLDGLRNLNITPQESFKYSEDMNNFARYVLSKEVLDSNDVQTLDDLLRICNILYNMSDMEILPIEDGVYDLLLEKYKTINPNFQVGSEIIVLPPTNNESEIKDIVNGIRFYTDEEWEKRSNGFYTDELYKERRLTPNDLIRPLFHNIDALSKRSHNTKHQHPELVGTLDKCKFVLTADAVKKGVENDSNVKILERDFFADHIMKGILDPNRKIKMILELKYDGVSVEADCTNAVESARTRGDTGIGEAANITPILEGYPFTNARDLIGEKPIGVKFEAIMTHADLYRFNLAKNYNYKNCRTAIVGLFGSSDAPLYRDYMTLIPLAIDRSDIPGIEWTRELEIEFLNKYFATKAHPLQYAIIEGDYKYCLFMIDKFVQEAEVARDYLDFMYDGVVVSYADEDLRQALGRKNFINKYSMAIKFNPLKKNTIFRGYSYTVGQDGSITPMIHYDQVEFYGTIHNKSTGSSYERFMKLGLRVGDIISVEYRNDVMPYIDKPDCVQNNNNTNPLCDFIKVCPDCGTPLKLSKSGKTMVCDNMDCNSRNIARMTNMMQKLNLKDFGAQRFEMLNKRFLRDIINITYDEISFLGPTNATKFLERMNELKTNPIYDYQIVGAIGFTGIASKKWKLIFENISLSDFYTLWKQGNIRTLNHIKGIGDSILDTIDVEMEYFEDDILYIMSMNNVISSMGSVDGKSIRCSGFRNPQLMEELRSRGYDADDNGSVTKSTDILLVPYADYSSSKTKKVGPDTLIVPIQEFLDNIDKFLQ